MNVCIHPPERPEEFSLLLLTLLAKAAIPDLLKSLQSTPEPRSA